MHTYIYIYIYLSRKPAGWVGCGVVVEKMATNQEYPAIRVRWRAILHPFVPLGFDYPWRRGERPFFGGLSWSLRWFACHVNNPQHNSYYVGGSCPPCACKAKWKISQHGEIKGGLVGAFFFIRGLSWGLWWCQKQFLSALSGFRFPPSQVHLCTDIYTAIFRIAAS